MVLTGHLSTPAGAAERASRPRLRAYPGWRDAALDVEACFVIDEGGDDGSGVEGRWLADAGLVVGAGRAAVAGAPGASAGLPPSAGARPDAMDAILLVLRTGMQWNALNATDVCSSSSAHRRFQEWEQAGVFHEIWRQGLLEYDTVVGIDWAWLAADGAMTKAPLGGPKTGPNPTDRAKKGRNVRFSARERGPRSGWRTTAPTATTNRSSSRP